MYPNLQKIIAMKPAFADNLRLPDEWKEKDSLDLFNIKCRAFKNMRTGLLVLVSIDTMEDGSEWLHVSFSYDNRLPGWQDLKEVKKLFIGSDRVALQIFPKDGDYVNVAPNCLHLWSPMP